MIAYHASFRRHAVTFYSLTGLLLPILLTIIWLRRPYIRACNRLLYSMASGILQMVEVGSDAVAQTLPVGFLRH